MSGINKITGNFLYRISALARKFSGRALASCGEALNFLEFFGSFLFQDKNERDNSNTFNVKTTITYLSSLIDLSYHHIKLISFQSSTIFLLLSLLLLSCDPEKGAKYREQQAANQAVEVNSDEEYVMVTTIVNYPMYVNHDQAAFKRWGQQHGVKTSILGPSEWDVQAQIATIEQVVGTRPTGLLINGTDPAIASAIDKAVEAGIPTVVYDSDIPKSKRHAFLGTDWYEMGVLMGEEVVKLIGGKGKIVYLGILGMTNMENGYRGLMDIIEQYPDIELLGKYDDQANAEVSAKIAADVLSANPDLAAFCAFTPMSGFGCAQTVKEASKVGEVKVTTVNYEPELLTLMEEGAIQQLVCQKRELFTWYGAQFLYDMVHNTNQLSENDRAIGIANVPHSVNTGTFAITPENMQPFLDR